MTFVYVLIGAAVAMGALWYFVLAPIERKNHERKLAILQEKISKHAAQTGDQQPSTQEDHHNSDDDHSRDD